MIVLGTKYSSAFHVVQMDPEVPKTHRYIRGPFLNARAAHDAGVGFLVAQEYGARVMVIEVHEEILWKQPQQEVKK